MRMTAGREGDSCARVSGVESSPQKAASESESRSQRRREIFISEILA
jgi:hypothetical protein